MPVWLFDDLDGDHLARYGRAATARRDQDVLVDTAIFRDHQRNAMLNQHAANDPGIGPLQDLDDHSLAAPAAIDPDHAHQRAIAMQDFGHLTGLEGEVLATIIRDEEAITVGMSLDAPGNQAGTFRQDV